MIDLTKLQDKENNPLNTVNNNVPAKNRLTAKEFLQIIKSIQEVQGSLKNVQINGKNLVEGENIVFTLSDFKNDAGYLTTHQSLVGYAKTTDIPTKLSALENDPNYATVEYVEAEIAKIDTSLFIAVETLPDTDIDIHKIYIMPSNNPEEGNIFTEYIYANDKWEIVGTANIDLSNYYTKSQATNLFQSKGQYYTKAEVNTMVGNIDQILDLLIGEQETS